jgi:hypothetical protein
VFVLAALGPGAQSDRHLLRYASLFDAMISEDLDALARGCLGAAPGAGLPSRRCAMLRRPWLWALAIGLAALLTMFSAAAASANAVWGS